MKLQHKILAIALVLLVLFAAAIGASALLQQGIRDEMAGIIDYHAPITDAIADFDVGSFEFELQLRRMAMHHEELKPDNIKSHAEQITKLTKRMRDDLDRALSLLDEAVRDTRNNVGDRLILSRVQGTLGNLRKQITPLLELGDRGAADMMAGNIDAAKTVFQSFRSFAGTYGDDLSGVRQEMTVFTNKSMNEAIENEQLSLWITLVLFAVAAAIGLAVSILISRNIIAALRELIVGTEAVESGKLDTTLTVRVNDEIGQLTRAFNRMIGELRLKERIKETFGRFVDPRVVTRLMDSAGDNPESAERRVATIFFSDLKGFSGISEQLTPVALVNLLNRYFTLMSAAIRDQRGVVDKYMGDGVMAFWTTPFSESEEAQAADACRAALAQLQAVQTLRGELPQLMGLRRNLPEVSVRMGLATGEVVVGTIGSAIAKSYTVIGDTVNLASRLEGINKVYGTNIIVSEHTWGLVKDEFELRELDLVIVVGKSEPIGIFELIGAKGSLSERQGALCANFAEALAAYRARDWDRAAALFEKCRQIDPKDAPSRVFSDRVKLLAQKPIEGDWDGVWRIDTK
jgi:adenylate cyclase